MFTFHADRAQRDRAIRIRESLIRAEKIGAGLNFSAKASAFQGGGVRASEKARPGKNWPARLRREGKYFCNPDFARERNSAGGFSVSPIGSRVRVVLLTRVKTTWVAGDSGRSYARRWRAKKRGQTLDPPCARFVDPGDSTYRRSCGFFDGPQRHTERRAAFQGSLALRGFRGASGAWTVNARVRVCLF